MSETLIVDCDGVLLNWRDGFNQWLYSHEIISSLEVWDRYQYNPPETELPPKVAKRLMNVFNQTHFISKLAPQPGAINAIKAFHQAGYFIHVVTAFSNEYESIKMRERNLENTFGPVFQEIVSLPVGATKIDFLRKMPQSSYYVEDVIKHLIEAQEVGMSPKRLELISQLWNHRDYYDSDKYPSIDRKQVYRGHWSQIQQRILGV